MGIQAFVGKAIMATTPEERQHWEDCVTVDLHAGRYVRGRASTIVVVTPDGDASFGVAAWDAMTTADGGAERLAELLARPGVRVIRGDVLFTPKDNPRPFRPARVAS